MDMEKIVLIVAQDQPDGNPDAAYRATARLIQMALETRDDDSDLPTVRAKVLDSCAELQKHLADGECVVDSVVFLSRTMMPKAEEIKKQHPKLRVVLMTAAPADDKVIVVDKRLLSACSATIAAVLG